jgi:hypothetical protein
MWKDHHERVKEGDLRHSRKYGGCPSVFPTSDDNCPPESTGELRKTGSKEPWLEMSRGSLFMNAARPMAHGVPSDRKRRSQPTLAAKLFGLVPVLYPTAAENLLEG